jgi:hypothetical protein
MEKKLKHHT